MKSSLALSLGLAGALSIVRFRAAIKDPEELVYLFPCIAVGLALGAELPLLAISLVLVSTCFIVLMHLTSRGHRQHRLLLTITGDSERHFSDSESGVLSVVDAVAGKYTLQRFEVEDGLRITLDYDLAYYDQTGRRMISASFPKPLEGLVVLKGKTPPGREAELRRWLHPFSPRATRCSKYVYGCSMIGVIRESEH